MLAQATLHLRPPEGYGQAARVLRGKVDPSLSPDAKPAPVIDEVTVRELADVTRGLPLSDATADQVQALADSGRPAFTVGQSIRAVLEGEAAPKGLALEATRRAVRWARQKRNAAPKAERPVTGTAAALDLRKGGMRMLTYDDLGEPAIGPPPTKNRAVHPFVGTVRIHGLPLIRLENLKGSTRSGTDSDGNAWAVTMPAHYGEFARSEGADGDPVDVFVGPQRHAPKAYVIHLQDPETGVHDEDKVFVAFATADDARACFAAAYNRSDLKMGPVRTLSTSELAEWLADRENRGQKIEAGRLLAKSAAPTSQTYGTPANVQKPKAAEPPPAPPPVAKPHHHADVMQLPTKPTKRFPPPSHPKPTKAPRKLMETPPELTKSQVQRGAADDLLKASGHKYVRRTPKAGGGYRYFYADSSAARGATEGESIRLGDHVARIGEVTDTHVTVDGKKITHSEWLDTLSSHYSNFERDAAKRAGLYARAVLRHVPTATLESRDAEAIYKHLGTALARTGMTPEAAQRAIAWAVDRKGWSPDASAALLGEMTIGQRAKWVQANYERVGAAAESRRGDAAAPVRAVHVAQAVDALAPKVEPTQRPHAELLADALAAEFPGMNMADLVQAIRASQAREHAAKAPPKTDGAETNVYLPGESGRPEKLSARFKLVEASELVASHDAGTFAPRKDYPQGLQERAYHRDKAEQAKVIRNAAALIPEYVANTNPDAVNGTPLVDSSGVVLGGNSRTMSMQRAYKDGGGAKLKAHLAENAGQFGLARKDVEAMEHPVLVRVVDTSARDPKLLVRQMNESMTQEMDPRVMQVAMGRKLDDDAVGKLAESMGTDHTLNEFLDSPASESFLQALRRVGIIDARSQTRYMRDGKLNADGKQLVERVLVGKVVGDPDLLSDTNSSVVTALAQAIPYMVQAEAHGAGYDLRNDLREALAAHNDMQRRGIGPKSAKDAGRAVQEYTRQDTMFGGGDSALSHTASALASNERAQSLASVLFAKTGPRQLSSVFRAYADGARHNPEGQFSMFGAMKTPAQILAESIDLAKSVRADASDLMKAQRHEADALLKAAGVDASEPKPPRKAAPKSDPASLAKNHERMQKLHTKAADEAADRGDGALSKLHADAAEAHTAAAHASGAGLPESDGLSKKAADATRATLPKEPEKPAAAPAPKPTAGGKGAAAAPAAPAQASGVGGRSKEGLKVIAIGPKGGKIVGYTTKDGKQKAIYEGSAGAQKLAATVATHAPEPKKPEAAPGSGPPEAKPADAAAPAAPAAEAGADAGAAAPDEKSPVGKGGDYHRAKQAEHAKAAATASKAGDTAGADKHLAAAQAHWNASLQNDKGVKGDDAAGASEWADEQSAKAGPGEADDAAAGDTPPPTDDAAGAQSGTPPAPDAPSEPIDDKPLTPDEPAGGTPSDAPAPEELGSASPKTDSPEARHAEELAKMRAQVEDAHKKLAALAHHIDNNLVPMFNNLKGQARATHKNPNPSAVIWLLSQIGRFVTFVLGLHEDKGKVTSATEAMNEKQGATGTDGREFDMNADGSFTETKDSKARTDAKKQEKPKLPQTRVIEKSLDARPLAKSIGDDLEGACVGVLVTLQAIERLHHAAHLQAKGPESYSDHLLFQRLYTDIQHEIDGLSEKMVAAFGPACVDAGVRSAGAADLLEEWVLSADVLARALDAEQQLQRAIARALERAPSVGLENLLQGIADTHDTAVYLLQQRMSPAVEKSLRATTSRQAHEADALLKSALALG